MLTAISLNKITAKNVMEFTELLYTYNKIELSISIIFIVKLICTILFRYVEKLLLCYTEKIKSRKFLITK